MRSPLAADQDSIDREASSWLVRIEDHGLDRNARTDFEEWLAADPLHERTYNDMRETWNELPGLSDLAGLVTVPDQPAPAVRGGHRTRYRRTGMMAGVGAVAAILIAVVTMQSDLLSLRPHYATELAETRLVTLPDGSSVTLGAKSSISVRFTDQERRVVLAGGEAFFDVIHNAARPFVVEAANSVVRDVGTKFDVNLGQGTVRVSVLEGAVQLHRINVASDRPQLLRAGQQSEVALAASAGEADTADTPPLITAQPSQPPGAWREGRLVFDNARLADLAADVNRYYAPGVRLASSDIGNLRVTASFKTNEIPAFMTALSGTLPVEAQQTSNGGFTVSASPH